MRNPGRKVDSRFDTLEAKIDSLRDDFRIWVLIFGLVITPLVTIIESHAVAAVWPVPAPAVDRVR